jgi:hypothetical protein
MAENLDLNIKINTSGAEGSIGSLKKQLREAQAEVMALSEKFGATSVEAVNAAKKAAELRDRIGDAKALTDAFNPDAKFKALTSSLSGVAGGFGAVQGAMALFGSESENVQKTLLKVQSAMALSQGLQAVGESIDSFKQLGAVIKSTSLYQAAYNFIMGTTVQVTKDATITTVEQTVALEAETVATTQVAVATTGATIALRLFRAALIATGIGALIAGIGLLIEYMSSLSGASEKARKAQEALNKSFVDGSKKANTQYLQDLDDLKETELARAGDDENAKFQIEEKYRQQKIDALNAHNEKIKGLDVEAEGEIQKQIAKLRNEGIVNYFANQSRLRKLANELKLEEEVAAALKEKKAIDAELAAYEKRKRGKQSGLTINDIELENKKAKDEKEKEDADKQQELLIEINKNGLGKMLQDKTTAFNKGIVLSQQNADANKAIDEAALISKQAQFETLVGFIGNLGAAFEQGTAASKTAAIAEIGINTALGYIQGLDIAQKGAKGTGPLAPFTMPIFYASQILAVIGAVGKAKQALSQVKGGGGSVPSVSSSAPMMPQIPNATTTNLSQQSINDIGNQAVRAYVIESDVTSNQQRIAAIRQRARFS